MGAQPLHYSMDIRWSDEDQAFIVTVPELSGCITHGFTYEEAVRQGQDAIESMLDALHAWGQPIPPPRVYAPVGEERADAIGRPQRSEVSASSESNDSGQTV